MPLSVIFNCLVYGDPVKRVFSAEISEDATFADLKNVIVKGSRFSRVLPEELELRKVDVYRDDLPKLVSGGAPAALGEEIGPLHVIREVFPEEINRTHLQLLVILPDVAERGTLPSHFPSRFFILFVLCHLSVCRFYLEMSRGVKRGIDFTQDREHFYKRVKCLPNPSALAKPSNFRAVQLPEDPLVLNGRPCGTIGLPVALAHPALGRFKDNVTGNALPEASAITAVLELSSILGELSGENEVARRGRISRAIGEYVGFQFSAYYFRDRCNTDGTAMRYWDTSFAAMLANLEQKRELGMGEGCPYLQSGAYYVRFLDKFQSGDVSRLSRLPSLLLYVAGPYLGVAGAAFLGLPVVEPLTPLVPLFYLPFDEDLMLGAARVLQAVKTAMHELETYYDRLTSDAPSLVAPQVTYPYLDSVRIADQNVAVEYVGRLGESVNVFRGRAGDREVVIKFVKRYSQECHLRCYGLGIAPELLAYQPLPGGLYVVVMEFMLGYETLFELHDNHKVTDEMVGAVEEAARRMHDEGFVHGDLRLLNILVGAGNLVKFIDFDWAGQAGKASYPPFMNSRISWHSDARQGRKILPDHDMFMFRSELTQTGK